jgi:iron complex outermembrane receptor protein
MKGWIHTLELLLFFCFLSTIRPAHAGPQTGEITGLISAPDGSGLPGARITVRRVNDGRTFEVIAGGRGVYRVADLPAGRYELRVELNGFEPSPLQEAVVSEGGSGKVDFKLAIATIREVVTVIGNAPRESVQSTEVRESSARDVGEAAAHALGLNKLRKGGIANDVVVRGFQSRDLNVLIDGERIYGACPNHMDPAAFHVDFAEVDRIEIGKGPFDVRNQGSLGGLVNIITRKPEQGFHATGNLSAGSYEFLNPSATVQYANNRVSALGGYSYRISKPFLYGSGKSFTEYGNYRPSAQESDAFAIGTAWGRFSVSPRSNHLLQVSYARQQADHILYPYLMMDAIYDDADRINFGYQIDNPFGRVEALTFQGYYTQVRHWMTDEFRTSSVNTPRSYSMGTYAATRTAGGKIEAGLNNLTFGMEVFSRYWSASTQMAGMAYKPQASIPDVETVAVGAYVEYRKSLRDDLRLELGGRVDRTDSSADPTLANTNLYFAYNSTTSTSAVDAFPSGSARLIYQLPVGLEFSAGIGSTVRIPDAVERYFALRRAGSDWVGNPALEPSRNTGFDGSASLRHRGLFASSSFFWNQVDNYIALTRAPKVNTVPGVMNSNARSYQNVEASIYGTEVQLVYSFTSRLFLSSAMAYMRGTQDPEPARNIFSTNLAEMPPINSRTDLRYDTGKYWAEIEGFFAGPQDNLDTDLQETPTPGYGIANARAGINFNRLAVAFGMQNIFDRFYYENLSYQRDPFRSGTRVYEPGRNLYLNISYRF